MDVLPVKIVLILTGKMRHIITHLQRNYNADVRKKSLFSVVLYLNADESMFRGDSRLVNLVRTIKSELISIGCSFPMSMVCLSVGCLS